MFIKSKNPQNYWINSSNVERILCLEKKGGPGFIIKFEMSSGTYYIWEYETRIERDEDFNRIVGNTLNEG
jgi:hypothetical protein